MIPLAAALLLTNSYEIDFAFGLSQIRVYLRKSAADFLVFEIRNSKSDIR